MSLDLSNIEGYVNENASEIRAKMTAGDTTSQKYTIQTGVKAPTAINILSTDAIFQDGSVAGWTPAGETSISQRILTPGDVKVQEAINPKDINKAFTANLARQGSYEDAIPFEEVYVNAKLSAINKNSEKGLWKGDITSANTQLNKFDGFLKIIDAEATVVAGNVSGATVITRDNVVGLIDDMYSVLDVDALEATDLTLAMGYDVARMYTSAHKDLDLRNYDAISGTFEFTIPATNVTAFATTGLNGTNRMVLSPASAMVVGVDLESDEEAFSLRYSQEDFVVKYHANFKKAAQVAYPESVVQFKLA